MEVFLTIRVCSGARERRGGLEGKRADEEELIDGRLFVTIDNVERCER